MQKYNIPCLDGVCSGEWLEAVLLKEVYEWCSLSGALEKSLLVKDGTRDIFAKSGSREEKTWKEIIFISRSHLRIIEWIILNNDRR